MKHVTHKILIVDDDAVIREILEFNLANEGFAITCAASAEEALECLTADHSLVLLDVMMGGMSGYKLAEHLRRAKNQVPVIFLTAKDTENDMLTGFSVGGDDYISKPFSIKEVVARVRAVLKRHQPPAPPVSRVLRFGEVAVDLEAKELTIGDRAIVLTRTEFELIALLAASPGRVFSRGEIIDTVWRETPFVTERTVDVHVTRLRKKLGARATLVTNRPGYGYRFNVPAS
jgi:DNA-binding response OmpR family regulator